MFSDWQTIIALILVAGALLFLGRKLLQFYERLQSGQGCPSDCGGCSSNRDTNNQHAPSSLVTLEVPPKEQGN